MNKKLTEEQAKKIFEKAVKLEREFGEFFTGKVLLSIQIQRHNQAYFLNITETNSSQL